MAGAAFKDQQTLKDLESFVPILVDGDVEKEVTGRFSVSGYPNTKFMDKKQKVLADVGGFVPTETFRDAVEDAKKKHGPIRLSKSYKKLLAASEKLVKAMEKERYKDALRAIKDVESIGHDGPDLAQAMKHKAAVEAVARERFTAAEATVAEDPDQAKKLFRKIASEFAGLEVADEAKERAKSID